MSDEFVCVFCGEKLGAFRSTSVRCAGIYQDACKSCEKELRGLDDAELCRRALRRGLARQAKRIEDHLKVLAGAEEHRPKCLRCGGKLTFCELTQLDNSPYHDGLLATTFEVVPALCHTCGKYEFYDPEYLKKDPFLAYLVCWDTGE